MRPHFMTVCDPQVQPGVVGIGYGGLYFNATVCRDHAARKSEIANAMQSFPSGHSVAAWAGLFYLSLYLNAHLKLVSNYHPSYWKLLVVVTPCVAATMIVGSLWLDMSHNWYDIMAGSAIGIAVAILSYRMCFASVWDFRWNHVPLRRGVLGDKMGGFSYDADDMVEWYGGCATRRAGWGVATGRFVGAPGDSSALFAEGPRRGKRSRAGVGNYHGEGGSARGLRNGGDGYQAGHRNSGNGFNGESSGTRRSHGNGPLEPDM